MARFQKLSDMLTKTFGQNEQNYLDRSKEEDQEEMDSTPQQEPLPSQSEDVVKNFQRSGNEKLDAMLKDPSKAFSREMIMPNEAELAYGKELVNSMPVAGSVRKTAAMVNNMGKGVQPIAEYEKNLAERLFESDAARKAKEAAAQVMESGTVRSGSQDKINKLEEIAKQVQDKTMRDRLFKRISQLVQDTKKRGGKVE